MIRASTNETTKRILLIEDDPLDIELACATLRSVNLDAAIETAASREELNAALERLEFDIVLSDFQLPGFSGVEALRMVRERDATVPFIFVSGMLGEENAVEMLRQGATDYVLKQRLSRLPLAVTRALTESHERAQRAIAETRLRERERYFSQVIDTLKDYSVATLDCDGNIESWNRASETLFGYSSAEIIGTSCARFFTVDATSSACTDLELLQRELDYAASAGSRASKYWQLRKDGSRFYASVLTTAIRNVDGSLRGFSRIVSDTTDSRIAADLLQAAKEQAEAANAAKDRFLAVLSHELRNPLSPIAVAAHIVELEKDLSDSARSAVAMIKRNVELEARLIDDLLDISRIVNDKLILELQPVDLVALVDSAVDMFRSEADARHIHLQFETSVPNALVYGDPARLQQIISNLLKNALKFTGSQGRVMVNVEHCAADKYAVTVTDTGAGIRRDNLEKIFVAFEQGDDTRAANRGGLGLGLAIANSLAQKHGGTLTVHSEGLGQGATFALTLQCYEPVVNGPGRIVANAPAVARWLRILLVEDNIDMCLALQVLLRQFGHAVDIAMNVLDARTILRNQTFDVLITDMGLPDGDGLEVLSEYRNCGGTFAIALTGYGMDSDIQRCLAAGFTEHMTKPVDIDMLRTLLGAGRATRASIDRVAKDTLQ